MTASAISETGRRGRERVGAQLADGDVVQFRKRRGAELVLLLIALAVGVGAYAVVERTLLDSWDSGIIKYGVGFSLLAIVAHIVVRWRAPYADPVVLPIAVLLNGLGLALIHRIDISRQLSAIAEGDPVPGALATRQLTWTALGVGLFLFVTVVLRDHRLLQRVTYTSGLAGVILLLLPLVPGIGRSVFGARIWIRIGPLNFQPGEVAKLLLIVFFAGYLVVKRDALALAGRRVLGRDLPRARDLGPLLLAWLISLAILVFQQDLGTSLLFFGTFVVLLYVATERAGWLLIGAILFVAGAMFGYAAFAHVRVRFNAWLDPFADPDTGYQIVQSLYGLAYGGILGRGLGQGRPTLVPLAESDFIVSVVGEELGVTGLIALIVIFGLLVERCLRTSVICADPFGKLLAVGFGTVLAFQVFVVIGGVTKLIPQTGLTTPFMSYGGSSLVSNWVLIALLLRISDQARRPPPVPLDIEPGMADDDRNPARVLPPEGVRLPPAGYGIPGQPLPPNYQTEQRGGDT